MFSNNLHNYVDLVLTFKMEVKTPMELNCDQGSVAQKTSAQANVVICLSMDRQEDSLHNGKDFADIFEFYQCFYLRENYIM